MAKILKQETVSKLNVKNINEASSREITRKFGKDEDFVEVHIYDLNGKRLQSINGFTDYTVPNSTGDDALVSEINIDYNSVLRSLGYRSGAYKVHTNVQRRKIFTQRKKAFSIKNISPSRTELKLETFRPNAELGRNAREFINLIKGSPLFRDFNLNFGNNTNLLGVNIDIDTTNPDKYALLVKTLKPIPQRITEGDKLNITEEIIEPLITTYDLGAPVLLEPEKTLAGPNFKIDVRLNDTIPTALKSYDNILSTDTTSSYQKLLSKLEGYEIPEIDYAYIRPTESSSIEMGEAAPSHFENFVHFGSATERLKNFEYKLNLLEIYDRQLKNIGTISGPTSQSAVVLTATASIASKKEKLIQDFDGYERFLYFESGTYSWPKENTTEPYIQANTTSSDALTWLGSSVDTNPYYGGQLNSASIYDTQNTNNLINTIPNHIGDKDENEPYLLFCNMIGNFFDPVWAHIKEITQIRHNSHIYGVSKDLVYYTLKSLGIDALDQFANQDLVNYILESKTTTVGELKTKVITGSKGVLPSQGDITKEIWKRLYHNAPYLLKTKGTARGLQALISCYGIPDTVLNVKEYMGSAPNRDDYNTFTQNKYLRILDGNSELSQGFFIESEWSSSLVAAMSASEKTIEFRVKPHRSDSQMHLLTLSSSISSSDMHLQLHPYTGSLDFYAENDRTQYGKLELVQFTSSIASSSGLPISGTLSSPYFPIYNGEFWNLYLNTDGASGSDATVGFGAYQANHLKEVNYFTQSVSISERTNSEVFGNPYYGGLTENNKITNGDFADSSAWVMNGGGTSTITGGKLVFANAQQYHYAYQSGLSIGRNKTYRLTFTVSDLTEGSVSAVLVTTEGESTTRAARTTNGTYTEDVTMPGDGSSVTAGQHDALWFEPKTAGSDTNSFKIDDVSLVEINDKRESGANILYAGGIRTGSSTYTTAFTGSSFDLEYSGSINEFRLYFGERLSHDTLYKHALEPFMYAGNSPTSSYNTLISRYPLSFELEDSVGNNETFIPSGSLTDSGSVDANGNPIYAANAWNQNPTASLTQNQELLDANAPITGGAILDDAAVSIINNQPGYPNHEPIFVVAGTPLLSSHHPNQNIKYLNAFSYLDDNNLSNHEEIHHLVTPNSVGRLTANNKIKIDSGSVEDNLLSTNILSQTPTLNRQGVDYDEIGVFFSPQNELNEDIVYTMGHFSIDDTLGDPRHQTSSYYPNLQALKDHYFQKLTAGSHRLNVFDFTRLVQFTDHTLFEMIKKFVPQKANLKTGLVIEPHYLERVKFERHHPVKSQILLDTEFSEVTQSFSKNNNISALDSTSGSVVITHTTTNHPDHELVINGTFNNDIDSWTDIAESYTTETWDSGRLKLVASGDNARITQEVTGLTIGKFYTYSYECIEKSGGSNFSHLGTTSGGVQILTNLGLGEVGIHEATFLAPSSSIFIQLGATDGGTVLFDNVSVKEKGIYTPRGVQSNLNTSLDVDKYISGSSNWEHGPIVPKALQPPTWKSPELIRNGTFTGNADNWLLAGSYNYNNNAVSSSAIQYAHLRQENTSSLFIKNRTYRVKFDTKNYSSGSSAEKAGEHKVTMYIISGENGDDLRYYGNATSNVSASLDAVVHHEKDITVSIAGGSSVWWHNQQNSFRFSNQNKSFANYEIDNISIREIGVNTKTRYSDTVKYENYNGPISLHPSMSWNTYTGAATSPYSDIQPTGYNVKTPYGNYSKGKLSKNYFITPGNPRVNHGLTTGSINTIVNGDFQDGSTGWSSTNTAVGNGVANFNGSAGNYPSITQNDCRRGGYGDKFEITFTVTDWNNGTLGGTTYTTLRLNMGTYPNDGVPSDLDNTDQTSFAATKYPLLMDSNTVQLNTPIKKTFISDGNNWLQMYVGNYDGDISVTNIELRKIEDRQSVRFDDSALDLEGWKRSRYKGSKLIGNKINKYTKGDITYGKNPVLSKKSTSIYFGTAIIGADGEEDTNLVKIKNHSYINIDSIISINGETDSLEVINTSMVPYESYQRLISNDLDSDKSFGLKILDKNVENKKKNKYKAKFSQGLLYKTVEHKGKNGSGNIYGEGIQAGSIYSSSYQNGPKSTRRSENLIQNPHFYDFGPELVVDGNFTGSYDNDTAGRENWEWGTLEANADGDGIFIQSIKNQSHQHAGLSSQFKLELEDGEFYRLEYEASSVDNGGGYHSSPMILGDQNRGGNNSYRPIGSSTTYLFNGKQIWDFKFDKSENNNLNFIRIYFQLTNADNTGSGNYSGYNKTARIKNVSLRKITHSEAGYTTSTGAGTPWTIVNGRAVAHPTPNFGYLNIATKVPMKNGATYEFELDVVSHTNDSDNGLKLANNLASGVGNLEVAQINGTYNGHQRVRWVHSDGNPVGDSSLNRIRLYNAAAWEGYVTNLRLYEVEPYETDINYFCYGKHNNTMNDSTLEIFKNDFTKEIWTSDDTFGLIDSVTSSAHKVTDSIDNVARFYDSRLLPAASESQRRLFVTFNEGQRKVAQKGIRIPSNIGIKSISTSELDLERYDFFQMNEVTTHQAGGTSTTATGTVSTLNYTSSFFNLSSSGHKVISGTFLSTHGTYGSLDTEWYLGSNRPITQPYNYLIPIKKEAHDLYKDYRKRRGGNTGQWSSTSINPFAQPVYLNYVFSGNSNMNAKYQISYLEERPAIIADINKKKDLMNGTGERGFILIPENLDINIKNNLDYYLSHLELIEEKDIKKIPKQKE